MSRYLIFHCIIKNRVPKVFSICLDDVISNDLTKSKKSKRYKLVVEIKNKYMKTVDLDTVLFKAN